MADFAALVAIAGKVSTDIDTKLSAKDAVIADLTAQLAAFQNDQVTVDQVVQTLTAADAKLG